MVSNNNDLKYSNENTTNNSDAIQNKSQGTINNNFNNNSEENQMNKNTENRIRLTFNNEEVIIKLNDNVASRDFLNLLPLTIELSDYNGTEKISYLSRKLSIAGMPSGIDPKVGDLTYYAPWGNIAIFYNDFGYSNGLISLGTIESGIDKLKNMKQNFSVTIEKIY